MEIRRTLQDLLGAKLLTLRPLHKSSFGPTYYAELEGYPALFVKSGDTSTERFFAEADGLAAIASSGAIAAPAVLAVNERFLALEYIESVPPAPGFQRRFGERLAAMHRVTAPRFGHRRDNFIGPLLQPNGSFKEFVDFYRAARLIPMRAHALGGLDGEARSLLGRLIDELDEHLTMEEPPSLIHGDLWNGNVLSAAGSEPIIFDPAVSYADRELDLAMLELFGGVDAEFYAGYDAVYPRRAGWAERQAIYQLYYLLVHVALFGGSYLASTKRVLRAIFS